MAKVQDSTRQKQVRAICDDARQKDYQVMVFNVFQQLDNMNSFSQGEARILDMVPMDKLSALIIFAESFLNMKIVNSLVLRAQRRNLPVICINRRVENCYNVLFAYEESFERLVRHIVDYHDCKRINFMVGVENNELSEARIRIFEKVLQENGIPFEGDRLAYGEFWQMPAKTACENWVAMWKSGKQEMPDAIICENDIMALTVESVLRKHDIHVPKDILLTGFDGIELGKYCSPKLTTSCEDIDLFGTEVFRMIDGCFANEKEKPYDIKIQFRTKISESCGCEEFQICNQNEQIMHWYNKSAEIRTHFADVFMMMTALTDGYSTVNMVEQLEVYQDMLAVDWMMIFINQAFYKESDLLVEDYEWGAMMLLAKIWDGMYSIPLQKIPKSEEYNTLEELLNEAGQILVLPLHWQEEVYGFMAVAYQDADKDLYSFYEFVLAFEQVLGTIRKQSELHRMYETDLLTQLYNRSGFYGCVRKKIKELSGKEKILFLASIDMDGVKYINDKYGQAEGDYAVKGVARCVRESVKGHMGICTRFGGDEYVVIILTEKEEADISFYQNYEAHLQSIVEQFRKDGRKPYYIGISVGSVYDRLDDMTDMDRLLKEADTKMYQQKEEHHQNRMY